MSTPTEVDEEQVLLDLQQLICDGSGQLLGSVWTTTAILANIFCLDQDRIKRLIPSHSREA